MKAKSLLLVFFVQFMVIALMFLNAYLPLFFGKEIKILVSGYDPRDLIAGNYVSLDFVVENNILQNSKKEKIFLNFIDENADNFFEYASLDNTQKSNVFLEFHNQSANAILANVENFKYFTTKQKALDLTQKLSQKNIKVVLSLKIYKDKFRITDLTF